LNIVNIVRYILAHPLNKGRGLAAIARFIKWQLKSRLVSGDIEIDWVGDAKLLASSGETGLTGNIYCGLHEFPEMAFLLHALRSQDRFADIGANVGSYTVLASAVVGAKTVCFEPVPATYNRLLLNIKLNGIVDKVTTHNVALGNTPGELAFSVDQNCMNHVIAEDEHATNRVTVEVSTLDDCLTEVPFLIKMDIEGYELPALQGAISSLSNVNLSALILELNGSGQRYGFDDAEIYTLMHQYDFNAYEYQPFTRNLRRLRKGESSSQGNTLFLRNIDVIQQRIQMAPKVDVNGVLI